MKNKLYIIGSLFVVACLIAMPLVRADKIQATPEEVVLVTAGQVLGQGLLDDWDWGEGSEINLSAMASPNIMSPWFSFGDVRQWAAHTESLNAASTTICNLQAPAATSTLVFASIYLEISSTTATGVVFTKSASTDNTATTTLIGERSDFVASATGVSMIASTTGNANVGTLQFLPNEWLVIGMQGKAGDTASTFSPTGTCQAVWTQLDY